MRKQIDYLIVGQGLAGSLLAHTLMARGASVHVFEGQLSLSASRAAAGLINPITGHRFNLTERFAEFIEVAEATYTQLDKAAEHNLYRSERQWRLIKNAGQRQYLEQRLQDPEYAPYLREAASSEIFRASSEYGVAEILGGKVVNVNRLTAAVKTTLLKTESLSETTFDHQALVNSEQGIKYHDFEARGIIYCEGYRALRNPALTSLPFKLAKGDVLSVQQGNASAFTHWLNWGQWLVPDDAPHTAKLGSNYEWGSVDALEANDTPSHADKLLQRAHEHTHYQLKLVDRVSGIRPSTRDRVPFVGPISTETNQYCFNGFGSKGCLLIPSYAQLLCDHLLLNKPLPKTVTQWL